MFNNFSEDESDARRTAMEEELRMKFNIPTRATSPVSHRKNVHNRQSTFTTSRGSVANLQDQDAASTRGLTTGMNLPGQLDTRSSPSLDTTQNLVRFPSAPDGVPFRSVKATHPLLITNNNTWDRVLAHMLNHGVIVNPFNHVTRFRLRSCFPPGTPTDVLSNGDYRKTTYQPIPELLRKANEVVMGPDWVKYTYENEAQAISALKSNGVVFDGFPLQVTVWGEGDDYAVQAASSAEAPSWLLGPAGTTSKSDSSQLDLNTLDGQTLRNARNPRQLVVVNDDNIFVKHPGFVERIKAMIYAYLILNTARYDNEGNYVSGSGGWLMDLWHMFMF